MKKTILILAVFGLMACATKKTSNLSPQEMQLAWEKASMVRSEHAMLKNLAGRYRTTVKWWTDPNAAPEVTKGSVNKSLIMGGRFLKEDYSGTSMGKPFQGLGLLGFDNTMEKYTSLWTDSMSTSFMTAYGDYSPQTKTFTFESDFVCPATKEKKHMVSTLTLVDNRRRIYESFDVMPDGSKTKVLEVEYIKQ